jgi:hypothetical protein
MSSTSDSMEIGDALIGQPGAAEHISADGIA